MREVAKDQENNKFLVIAVVLTPDLSTLRGIAFGGNQSSRVRGSLIRSVLPRFLVPI